MLPLAGKNILVTRASSQSSSITKEVEQLGGKVLHAPLLQFKLNDSLDNQHILTKLHDFSWVFLTSSNGVKFFFELINRYKIKIPEHCKWAVVGDKPAHMLETCGIGAHFIPSDYQASSMIEQFFEQVEKPGKILFVRGNRSREILPRAFRELGVFFKTVTVYDTLLVKENDLLAAQLEKLDAVTFTSPSTVEAFMRLTKDQKELALEIPSFCIGPTTGNAAKSSGFKTVYVPEAYTIKSMVDNMTDHFDKKG